MHTAEGHRNRLKDRFRNEGLAHFEEVHVLELVLFYVIARKDTKPVARALMDRFGSLKAVIEAHPKELQKVPGVGENVATFLKLLQEFTQYYYIKRTEMPKVIHDMNECGRYLANYFLGQSNEVVYLLCLDAKCGVLGLTKIGEGTVNSANVSLRKIAETALAYGACSVVVAHNHPGGLAMPSGEDIRTTRMIGQALDLVGVCLVDHVVVSDGDFVSMRQSGLYMAPNM